jgi:hypothetical protein
MMNATGNEANSAAAAWLASTSGFMRLQKLKALLRAAREKLERREVLSRADMQRLNVALDDFSAV